MRSKKRGFGLLELLMTLSLFSLLTLLSVQVLSRGIHSWNTVMSGETATLELARATTRLEWDLRAASLSQLNIKNGRSSFGGAPDGHALWFLSGRDPVSGEQVRDETGSVFWQRNILYYLTVPNNHSALFGFNCTAGAGPLGLDDRCPHKVLIRKVIDRGGATTSDPLASEEEALMSADQVNQYLTRPNGYDTSAMSGENGLEEAVIVAKLLYFSATVQTSATVPDEIVLDLRAFELMRARNIAIGTTPLAQHPRSKCRLYSVFPNN